MLLLGEIKCDGVQGLFEKVVNWYDLNKIFQIMIMQLKIYIKM